MFSAAPVLQSVVLDANNNLADARSLVRDLHGDVLLMKALMKAVPDRAALFNRWRLRPACLGRFWPGAGRREDMYPHGMSAM